MNMKLWNFLEKSDNAKNRIVHIENKDFQYDDHDNDQVSYSVQLNIENSDDESLIATYTVLDSDESDLKKIVNHIIEKYFSDDMIIDHENLLKN